MLETTLGTGRVPSGILRAIGRVIRSWFTAYRRRQTLHELATLDDHILQDIGIDRAELNAAVSRELDR